MRLEERGSVAKRIVGRSLEILGAPLLGCVINPRGQSSLCQSASHEARELVKKYREGIYTAPNSQDKAEQWAVNDLVEQGRILEHDGHAITIEESIKL